MSLLVTGASGTIGSVLTRRLLERKADIYCQSRSDRVSQQGEKWLRFDLLDSEIALRGSPEFEIVFHLAALTSTREAKQNPVSALQDNIGGLVALLEALRVQKIVPKVVVAGTVTEVGFPDTSDINERLCDKPITFYDVSKLAAENFFLQYVREGWLRGCCLRLATVYGGMGEGQSVDRGVIDGVMRRALEGRPIHVYGDGRWLRDYIHVDDVVDALIAAADHPNETNGRSFVIGTGHGISIKDAFSCAVQLAASLTGNEVAIEHVVPPDDMSPIEFRDAVVDSRAFRAATGWFPRYDLLSGLARSYGAGQSLGER